MLAVKEVNNENMALPCKMKFPGLINTQDITAKSSQGPQQHSQTDKSRLAVYD